MKKRLVFAIALIVIFSTTVLMYSRYQYNERSITEVTGLKADDITKIVLKDEQTRSYSIKDKQKINEFFKLMDSDIIKMEKKHQLSNGGWLYYVDFYTNNKKVTTLVFDNDLAIGRKYYEIIKGDLNREKISDLIYVTNPNN